ncbi:MAG: GlsB/YeaQ/YmgE family stress response membrane protein [Polyangiales bacterium]
MGIISWLGFGLLAGILAKFVMPGDDGGGFIKTTLLGVAGAMVGGFVGTQLGFGDVTGFNVRSFGIAIAGAVAVLWLYRMLKKK